MIQRVDKDERWLSSRTGYDLGEHIDGDETRETECSGLVEIREVGEGPFEDLGRIKLAEVRVDRRKGFRRGWGVDRGRCHDGVGYRWDEDGVDVSLSSIND